MSQRKSSTYWVSVILLYAWREWFRHPSDLRKDFRQTFSCLPRSSVPLWNTSPYMTQPLFAPTICVPHPCYSFVCEESWDLAQPTLCSTFHCFVLSSFSFMNSVGEEKIACGMKRNTDVIEKQNCEKQKKMSLIKLWNDYRLIHQWKHMETVIPKFNSYETWNCSLFGSELRIWPVGIYVKCLSEYGGKHLIGSLKDS